MAGAGSQARPHRAVDVQPVAIPSCPLCGARVDLAAVVEADEPGRGAQWFWGMAGQRWIVCPRQGAWVHIAVGQRGRGVMHRLAYLAPHARPPVTTLQPSLW